MHAKKIRKHTKIVTIKPTAPKYSLFIFTSNRYADRVLHDYDSVLSMVEKTISSPHQTLKQLKNKEISKIEVPGGEITLYDKNSRAE